MQTSRSRALAITLAGTLTTFLATCLPLQGQTVANPRLVEFAPSPDHNATLSTGQQAVSYYDLEVYNQGAYAPFHTVSMGKPSPQADGKVRFDFSTQVAAWPLPGGTYEARVSAVGPNGKGRSDVSNPFTFDQAPVTCSYSISPSSASLAAAGGNGSFSVMAGSGCGWTVTSSVTWIALGTSGGTANGTVSFTVAANSSTSSRKGTISVGGKTFTITQSADATPCSYTIAPTGASVSSSGGSGSFAVTAAGSCSWNATTTTAWIKLASASGSGSASVSYNIDPHQGSASRTGAITVADQTFTVTQDGTEPTSCTYAISPQTLSIAATGGSGTITVSTGGSCAWTATPSATWVTTSATSGSGSDSVSFSIAPNTGAEERSATVTVTGSTLTITQAAADAPSPVCFYAISPAAHTMPAAGGGAAFDLSTADTCAWSAAADSTWVRVSQPTGRGGGRITFSVDPNPAPSARSASIVVNGESVKVGQEGQACTYLVDPAERQMPATGGRGEFGVTTPAGCTWTAVSSADWLVALVASGDGPGRIGYEVRENNSAAAKRATITVGSQSFTLTIAAGRSPGPPKNLQITVVR